MILATRVLILSGVILAGCTTARDVAVTSFRVLDAPANYVRRKIDPPPETTVTTTTETSDVVIPGRPLNVPPPAPEGRQRRVVTDDQQVPASPPPRRTTSAPPQPKPTPAATQPVQFPAAKPVPGRPGYVYSLDPKGGIVDVTGYKPGDKARDPYTKQIFIVP
jgi:hypothetical protein